jgi:hypothetical protein
LTYAGTQTATDGTLVAELGLTGGRWDFPGFGPLTRIETDIGDFHAGALRLRDRVRTRRGTFAEIRWIDRVLLDETFLARHPEACPVLIHAGALGRGLPKKDALVSPGQVVVLDGPPRRERTAAELVDSGKAMRKPETIFTYTLFICAQPVEVRMEGLWVSLSPPRW